MLRLSRRLLSSRHISIQTHQPMLHTDLFVRTHRPPMRGVSADLCPTAGSGSVVTLGVWIGVEGFRAD